MKLDELTLHPLLRKHVTAYCADPPHALLVYGKKSSGKATLVRAMAEAMQLQRIGSTIIEIRPLEDKKVITIDQIKQLKIALRTKNLAFRIFLIPDAEQLNTEAQNTFLKLLEEPPEGVIFILTTSRQTGLLQTVRSRLLKLRYIAPTKDQQLAFARSYTSDPVDTFMLIADGRIPVLKAILDTEESNAVLGRIELAKDILSESIEARLLRVDTLSKDSQETEAVLDALLAACSAALRQTIRNNKDYISWLKRIRAVEAALNQIERNVLAKLVLSRLFLVL